LGFCLLRECSQPLNVANWHWNKWVLCHKGHTVKFKATEFPTKKLGNTEFNALFV
jgi:hypothetical protein